MSLMKKVFSLYLLFSCIFMTGVPASDSEELVIKAYKIARLDERGISEFVVTDALADFDDLNKITNSDVDTGIILDEHINTYLGNGSTRLDEGAFSEQIVFSVRVAGAGSSEYFETEPTWWGGTSEKLVSEKYKVTMTFFPFYYGADLSDIKASYQLGNITGIFEKNSSHTSGNERIKTPDNKEPEDSIGINDFVYVNGKESQDLWFEWEVETTADSSSTWIVRAAVAMTVDSTSYEKCTEYGRHSAQVIVKLEVA